MKNWIEYELKPLIWAIVHADFRKCSIEIQLPVSFKKPSIDWDYGDLEIHWLIKFRKPSIGVSIPPSDLEKYARSQGEPVHKYFNPYKIPF